MVFRHRSRRNLDQLRIFYMPFEYRLLLILENRNMQITVADGLKYSVLGLFKGVPMSFEDLRVPKNV